MVGTRVDEGMASGVRVIASETDTRARARRRTCGAASITWQRASSRSCKSSSRDGPISESDVTSRVVPGVAIPAALGAIMLWGTLATLRALASRVCRRVPHRVRDIGAVPGLLHVRQWRVPAATLLLGVSALFGFHFLLFLALRFAPPVEPIYVDFLWPLLIVLLTPLLLPDGGCGPSTSRPPRSARWRCAGDRRRTDDHHPGDRAGMRLPPDRACLGVLFVAHAARRPFSSWAIGGFALVPGALALVCHLLFEAPASMRRRRRVELALLGLGPMGSTFCAVGTSR